MKKLFYLALVLPVVILFLNSCNKDDDSNNNEDKKLELIGSYNASEVNLVGSGNIRIPLNGVTGSVSLAQKSGDDYTLKFKEVVLKLNSTTISLSTDADTSFSLIDGTESYEMKSLEGNATVKFPLNATIPTTSLIKGWLAGESVPGIDNINIVLSEVDYNFVISDVNDAVDYKSKKYKGVVYEEESKPTLKLGISLNLRINRASLNLDKLAEGIQNPTLRNIVKKNKTNAALQAYFESKISALVTESIKNYILVAKFVR